MPDPRAQWFVVNDRQDRWWLYGADRKPLYSSIDAEPLPTESQREKASYPRRLAFRLLALIRPGDRGLRWTLKPPAQGVGDGT